MMTRFCVAAAACVILASSRSLPAQTPAPIQGYELDGTILDGSGRPLALVEVALIRDAVIAHTVISGDNGRFTFGVVAAGPVTLHFRRLGYTPHTMDMAVGPGGHPAISGIVLTESPSQLAEITISTEAGSDRYRAFNERRQKRASFGRFLDHRDIRRLSPRNASDLFRSVPGITIRAAAGGNSIRIRGCQPMVRIDGQRVPGAELDEVTQPDDIGAIEFYPSFAGVPAQYAERGNRLCGLILVWTR